MSSELSVAKIVRRVAREHSAVADLHSTEVDPGKEIVTTMGISHPERFSAEQIRRIQRARGLRDGPRSSRTRLGRIGW